MRIGFIGLGNMGGPMALNLVKAGHTLVVHGVRRESVKQHLDAGATWADGPKDVARAGELILTSLPGPAEVEAVALGPNGTIEGAQPGSIYADLSTNSPTVMRKIHAAFKAKGVHVLAIGNSVGYMGAIGSGTIAKLVHNMISILSRSLIAEGFTLGVKAGVKPEALLEAVRGASYGQGLTLSHMIPDVVFKGEFDTVRFALKLARKDVGLATALAREDDVPMPMAVVGEQILIAAMARGWGDRDSTSPWELQEEAARVKVRSSK